MELTVSALSSPVQITAALFVLRLIRVTGGSTAWVPIAVASCFMGLRRNISLWGMLYGELPHAQDLWAKSVVLVTSPSTKGHFNHSSGICHDN